MKEYGNNKEIMNLVKDYKDLCEQIKNPNREKMEEVLLSVYSHNIIDGFFIESKEGPITNIKNISTPILYRKLPRYKKMCETKLINKIGKEKFQTIKEVL